MNQTSRRRRSNPETSLTRAALDFLNLHPAIEWAERINTGTTKIQGRFIRFGFKGCSDVIGQATRRYGGVFIAVETKGPRKYPSKDQRAFLAAVEAAGGFAWWGRSVTDLEAALRRWTGERPPPGSAGEPPRGST